MFEGKGKWFGSCHVGRKCTTWEDAGGQFNERTGKEHSEMRFKKLETSSCLGCGDTEEETVSQQR